MDSRTDIDAGQIVTTHVPADGYRDPETLPRLHYASKLLGRGIRFTVCGRRIEAWWRPATDEQVERLQTCGHCAPIVEYLLRVGEGRYMSSMIRDVLREAYEQGGEELANSKEIAMHEELRKEMAQIRVAAELQKNLPPPEPLVVTMVISKSRAEIGMRYYEGGVERGMRGLPAGTYSVHISNVQVQA